MTRPTCDRKLYSASDWALLTTLLKLERALVKLPKLPLDTRLPRWWPETHPASNDDASDAQLGTATVRIAGLSGRAWAASAPEESGRRCACRGVVGCGTPAPLWLRAWLWTAGGGSESISCGVAPWSPWRAVAAAAAVAVEEPLVSLYLAGLTCRLCRLPLRSLPWPPPKQESMAASGQALVSRRLRLPPPALCQRCAEPHRSFFCHCAVAGDCLMAVPGVCVGQRAELIRGSAGSIAPKDWRLQRLIP